MVAFNCRCFQQALSLNICSYRNNMTLKNRKSEIKTKHIHLENPANIGLSLRAYSSIVYCLWIFFRLCFKYFYIQFYSLAQYLKINDFY